MNEDENFLKKVIDNLLNYNQKYFDTTNSYTKMLQTKDDQFIRIYLHRAFYKRYEKDQMKIPLENTLERENLLAQLKAVRERIDKKDHYSLEQVYKQYQEDELLKLKNLHMVNHIHLIYNYVAEYIFNKLDLLREEQQIKENLTITKEQFKTIFTNYKRNDKRFSIDTIYRQIIEGLDYVVGLCRINNIKIEEIKKLYGEQECKEVDLLENFTIHKCLSDTNAFLFVTVSVSNYAGVCYNYHPVCYSKEQFIELLTRGIRKYPCDENETDPITYIKLPIGANTTNVYIPLLSAIMILQTDKRIIYLVKPDTEIKYCYNQVSDSDKKIIDLNTPIMHLAICSGPDCAPKGWKGSETNFVESENDEREKNFKILKKKREKKMKEEQRKRAKQSENMGYGKWLNSLQRKSWY